MTKFFPRVMKMRPVDGGLEIKPGAVTLKPCAYDMMFLSLKHAGVGRRMQEAAGALIPRLFLLECCY
jgi:hypothetical protein